jgi:uncharacterized membrane protein
MRIGTSAIIAICLSTAGAGSAFAKPDYLATLQSHVKVGSGPFAERACANCHVSNADFGLNHFGKQVAQEKIAANARTVTAAVLEKAVALDANGDGVTNLDELKAGKDPSAAVAGVKPPDPGPAPEKPKTNPLLPKNAWHPAIVHFPIALFLGGLAIDALGFRRRDARLLLTGWYNLLFAALTTFGALVSGYVATLMMKMPIAGITQQHMLMALGATVLMWIMVALRAKQHENMSKGRLIAYACIALVNFVLISYSGHLGGVLVYGE